jgi:hypothetical protein
MTRKLLRYIFIYIPLLIIFALSNTFALTVPAQVSSSQASSPNPQLPPQNINLSITKVVKDGKDVPTNQISKQVWASKEVLNSGDGIKYQWDNTKIGVYFEKNPALCCGFIRVYKEDETKEENYLTTTGSDDYPLKLSKFADKLKSGKNNLIFVFFDHTNKPTANKSTLVIDFISQSPKPKLTVVKPTTGTVFAKDITSNIVLEVENFKLTTISDGKDSNIGKINVYGNTTENLLNSITSGVEVADGKVRVDVKPETWQNFDKLPDNKNTKLIFQLVSPAEKDPVFEEKLEIITNFGNSIDVGLPKVFILDPVKTSTNLQINTDTIFKLKTENFEMLSKAPLNNSSPPDNKKGFLQIFVDNKPLQTTWNKTEFSLKEIGYLSAESGEKEVKIQLVNQNYEKLSPEAIDKIKVQYNAPNLTNIQNASQNPQTSNWKIIIIALTVILIVGGILISITKS